MKNRSRKSRLLLYHINWLNPNKTHQSFRIKVQEIGLDVYRQAQEMNDVSAAKNQVLGEELVRMNNLSYQYKADESHVGDQCPVCLER